MGLSLCGQETVEHAITDLPRAFRIPLVLKDLADLRVSEVAGIPGLKEATVKTRVHRARIRLRRHLAERLPGREPARSESRSGFNATWVDPLRVEQLAGTFVRGVSQTNRRS